MQGVAMAKGITVFIRNPERASQFRLRFSLGQEVTRAGEHLVTGRSNIDSPLFRKSAQKALRLLFEDAKNLPFKGVLTGADFFEPIPLDRVEDRQRDALFEKTLRLLIKAITESYGEIGEYIVSFGLLTVREANIVWKVIPGNLIIVAD